MRHGYRRDDAYMTSDRQNISYRFWGKERTTKYNKVHTDELCASKANMFDKDGGWPGLCRSYDATLTLGASQ